MQRILLSHNEAYKWLHMGNIRFKGYITKKTTLGFSVIRDEEAIALLLSIGTYKQFIDFLKDIDGSYSIVIEARDEVWCAVDIARSMPLYFSDDGLFISDSADTIRKNLDIPREDVNGLRVLELFETTFVAHNNTVYDRIKQLDLGQCMRIEKSSITIDTYFVHSMPVMIDNEVDATKRVEIVAPNAIKEALAVVGNRPIVLSLSGGYDSRFIACTLKSLGVENVSCYSYGSLKSPDVIESKKVADALNYRWICVEHTDDRVRNVLGEEISSYFEMCNGHDHSVYLQNYVAVKYLHDTGWFERDSVFITGLCHDMPTGAYVKAEDHYSSYAMNIEGVAEYVYSNRFVRHTLPSKTKEIFIKELLDRLLELGTRVDDLQSFIAAVDSITTGYDHSRRFLHMNSVHEYFGYEWITPCWNRDLLCFWYSLAYQLRIKQNFYEKWLLKSVFSVYGLSTAKIIMMYSANPNLVRIKRIAGSLLIKMMYPLGIPLRRSVDLNNWAPLELEIYRRIKCKRVIDYKRAAFTMLLTIYIIEQRYTTIAWDKMRHFLNCE